MFLIKFLINITISIFLFCKTILLQNWKKNLQLIFSSDIIIYTLKVAFGHQIEINDASRYYYDKKKFYIFVCITSVVLIYIFQKYLAMNV